MPVKGGYDHSSDLVTQIARLNEGGLYLDEQLQNAQKTHFCTGVAGYPEKHGEAPNLSYDIQMLKKKVDSGGAQYIVTQMFFDNSVYYRFVDACRKEGITVPIIPGIKPIGSKRDLATIPPQTFHVDFPPDELVSLLNGAKKLAEIREIGEYWCIKQAKDLIAHDVPPVCISIPLERQTG